MTNNGWVKLHRSILDWEWFEDHNTCRLFLYLLIKANHSDNQWMGVTIKRGQLVTGRKALALATGLTEQSVRTSLTRLKSTSEITIKSTSKYSVITIVNWAKFQNDDQQSTSKSTSKSTSNQPASNQQVTTNKNDKKEKNDKNILATIVAEPINELIPLFEEINPSWKTLYSNRTQRAALERLLKDHGFSKLKSMLERLPAIVTRPFAPRVTTPIQLEAKLGELIIFARQTQTQSKKGGYVDATA